MSNRVKIIEQREGMIRAELETAYEHRDGNLLLRVEWSVDDDCWVARYHHDDPTSNAIGIGDTVQDALAHLCGALSSEIAAWRDLYMEKGGPQP